MNELKRCPFCGGEAVLIEAETKVGAWVKCTNCGIGGSAEVTKEAAAEAWNSRAELGWIKATPESMPGKAEEVLVTCIDDRTGEKSVFDSMQYDSHTEMWLRWSDAFIDWVPIDDYIRVSHWMPLPEPPKED